MKNLRKLIRESIEEVLNESMNMGIENFNYDDDLDHILDISHYVVKKVAYDLWPKLNLTKEEEEQIGGIGDDFTPDGNDAFEQTGVMNFYAGKFPPRVIQTILGYIKYILGEKDIKLGEFKFEKVKDKVKPEDFEQWGITDGGESLRVIRIPIIENGSGDSGNPPEIGFSNTNAKQLFNNILGFQGDSSYHMDATDLLMKIDQARKQMVGRKDIPDEEQYVQKGMMHSTVNGKDYYYRVFDQLEEFAKWAITRGYRNLYVA